MIERYPFSPMTLSYPQYKGVIYTLKRCKKFKVSRGKVYTNEKTLCGRLKEDSLKFLNCDKADLRDYHILLRGIVESVIFD